MLENLKENKCNIINIGNRDEPVDYESMIPDSVFECELPDADIEIIEENLPTQQGMDDLSESLFNALLEKLLDKGKIRDAMLITLHANFGMRNADISNLRLIEILKSDKTFRTRISHIEQKTSKIRQFYINEAIRIAVSSYLKFNPKKRLLHYIITSEGRRKTYKMASIKGKNGNLYMYETQAPLSRIQEERAIKDNLIELGVMLKNDPRCQGGELKLNTHSLRKLYVEKFMETAYKLKQEGVIDIDTQVITLVQMDLAHSSGQTTMRYSRSFEKKKEVICNHMNIGLEVWKNFIKKQSTH
ncbi:MAG: site-specific integrase [Ruminococcus flavefaciens]|nr:site-specific integrase [Ruminococcus flavefaciens]MCM1361565.1 site-specific integrase [Clostridiales bacterium]